MPLRSVAPALLLLSLLLLNCLLLPAAHAGSYYWTGTDPKTGKTIQSPTYTGGDYSFTHPVSRIPDALVSGEGWGGKTGADYGVNFVTGQSVSGAADCGAAPISVTFTWHHDNSGQTDLTDPPPPVIVSETTMSGWSATGPGSSGSFTNPFQFPTVAATNGYGSSETGTHYSVKPGADTLSFSALLTSSASGTGSASASGIYSLSVWVNYAVSVAPITTTLKGQNPANQALTGQQITATLNGAGALPSGSKITSYAWSFSGGTNGNPIRNWDPFGVSPVDKKTPQQLFPFLPADLTTTDTTGKGLGSVSPISFYDQSADTVKAQCVVNFTFPDGTKASATAVSSPVAFFKPTASWGITTGDVHYSSSNSTPAGGAYGLYPAFGSSAPGGVYWHDVIVTVPSPFSGGTCCFTQLVQPNHQYNGIGAGVNNNVNGLDNSFEYFNYTWAPGSKGTENDSPALIAGPGNNIGDVDKANDAFQAWIMYQPTGGIWVPLQMYPYSWAVTLTWVMPGTWSMSGQSPPPPNPGPSYTGTVTDIPPQWSVVQTNE